MLTQTALGLSMRNCLWLFLATLAFLMSSYGRAAPLNSIYEAEVPVASQSNEDKAAAAKIALEQVLIKVSGDNQVLDNPYLKTRLETADSLIQEYSYTLLEGNRFTPYLIHIDFDPEAVRYLLRNIGAPVWGSNRPTIIVWSELEVPGRVADIVNSDSQPQIQNLFLSYAKKRGLPFIFPLMDMSEMNQVSVNDVVTMSIPDLRAASKRYSADALLIVRIFQEVGGYSAQSRLVMGKKIWDAKFTGRSMDEVIGQLVNNVADTLAGRFATVSSPPVHEDKVEVSLRVVNVNNQSDLSDLMSYLRSINVVESVQPVNIGANEVELSIALKSSKQDFVQAISLSNKLIPYRDSYGWVYFEWNP